MDWDRLGRESKTGSNAGESVGKTVTKESIDFGQRHNVPPHALFENVATSGLNLSSLLRLKQWLGRTEETNKEISC